MVKELLSTINIQDAAAGGLLAGTAVYFLRNPKTIMKALRWVVGHNGHKDDTQTLTISKHAQICDSTIEPIKTDITDIKMRVVEIGTDVVWVKKRLENGEYDFRELHRKIDALKL